MEQKSFLKLSDLNEVAVFPKPDKRQRVSNCQQVFSEKTHATSLNHPLLDNEEVKDTAAFILKVLNWWKILNAKACGVEIKKCDPNRAPIDNPRDQRLLLLQEFGTMCLKMAGKQGCRIQQFSKDTAAAIHQTCFNMVNFCRHLL